MMLDYRDSGQSKEAGITYHLAIVAEWEAQKADGQYVPSAYATDGFIHCTNGLDLLTEVANGFYKTSSDKRVVLVLDTSRIDSELRYDDEGGTFPHIYGPLNTAAVICELPVLRADDGTFTRLGGGA